MELWKWTSWFNFVIVFTSQFLPDYAILGVANGKKKKKVNVPICYFHGIALKRNEKSFHLHQDLKMTFMCARAFMRSHTQMWAGASSAQSHPCPRQQWVPDAGAGHETQVLCRSHASSPHIKILFDDVFLCSLVGPPRPQAGLEAEGILLPQLPRFWDYRWIPPCTGLHDVSIKKFSLSKFGSGGLTVR